MYANALRVEELGLVGIKEFGVLGGCDIGLPPGGAEALDVGDDGAAFFVVRWALTRSFDRYYAAGYAAMVAACAMIMGVAPTEAWGRVASFLVG